MPGALLALGTVVAGRIWRSAPPRQGPLAGRGVVPALAAEPAAGRQPEPPPGVAL